MNDLQLKKGKVISKWRGYGKRLLVMVSVLCVGLSYFFLNVEPAQAASETVTVKLRCSVMVIWRGSYNVRIDIKNDGGKIVDIGPAHMNPTIPCYFKFNSVAVTPKEGTYTLNGKTVKLSGTELEDAMAQAGYETPTLTVVSEKEEADPQHLSSSIKGNLGFYTVSYEFTPLRNEVELSDGSIFNGESALSVDSYDGGFYEIVTSGTSTYWNRGLGVSAIQIKDAYYTFECQVEPQKQETINGEDFTHYNAKGVLTPEDALDLGRITAKDKDGNPIPNDQLTVDHNELDVINKAIEEDMDGDYPLTVVTPDGTQTTINITLQP